MKKSKTPRSSIIAFRTTPLVMAQLRELAGQESQTLSAWMNLRAQEAIQAISARKAEAQSGQDGLL